MNEKEKIAKLKNKIFGSDKERLDKIKNNPNYAVILDDNPERIDLLETIPKLTDEEYKQQVLKLHEKAIRGEL